MLRRPLVYFLLLFPAFSVDAQESPQALQEAFLDAIRVGDIDALAALYAEDAASFPIGEMVGHGRDGVRSAWGPFLEAYDVTAFEIKDSHVEIIEDSAVAWGQWTLTAVPTGRGERIDIEGRFMDMAKKIDGKWRYVVHHASAPLWAEEGH